MAEAGDGKTIKGGSVSVVVFPDLQKFASSLLNALNSAIKTIDPGAVIGSGLATSIEESMRGISAPEIEIPIEASDKPVQDALSGIGSRLEAFGAIGTRAMGTIASAATNVLGSAVKGVGGMLSDTLSTSAKVGLGGIGAAAGAVIATSVGGGLSRALSLNEAEAGLQALGYEGKRLEKVMDSAMAGVEGTAFMTADAAAASTAFLTAGIDPGEELVGVLQNISNVAAQSGSGFGEIAAIMQRVSSTGKLMGNEIDMLEQRNIPIVQALSDSMGVATEDIRALGSEGKIGFKELNDALSSSDLIAEASKMAELSFSAAFSNLRAYMGMLTQPIWTEALKGAIPAINELKDRLAEVVGSEEFTEFIAPALAKVEGFFRKISAWLTNTDFTEFFAKFENGTKKLEGAIAPIIGLLVGLSGTFLSRIPIIGAAFSSLTGPVGLFAGILFSAYQSSEFFQVTLKQLWAQLKTTGRLIGQSFKSDDAVGFSDVFERVGDIFGIVVERIIAGVQALQPYLQAFANGLGQEGGMDGIEKAIVGVADVIGGAIGIIVDVLTNPQLIAAAQELLNSLSGIFGDLFSSLGATDQLGLADTLVSLLVGVFAGLAVVAQDIANVVSGISSAWNSGFMVWLREAVAGLFAGISGAEEGENLVSKFAEVVTKLVGAFFFLSIGASIVGKGIAVGLAIGGFVSKFIRSSAAIGTAAKSKGAIAILGTSMATIGKSLKAGAIAISSSLLVILKGLGAITLIAAAVIVAVAAIGQLLRIEAVRDGITAFLGLITEIGATLAPFINTILDFIKDVMAMLVGGIVMIASALLPEIAPILAELSNFIIEFLQTTIVGIAILVESLLGGLALAIDSLSILLATAFSGVSMLLGDIERLLLVSAFVIVSVLEAITFSLIDLMEALVMNGVVAGGAAIVLAGGLAALMAVLVGGGLVGSIGSLGEAAVDGLTAGLRNLTGTAREAGKERSLIDTIIDLGEALSGAHSIVESMPETWGTVSAIAPIYGREIIEEFTSGILSGADSVSNATTSVITDAIQDAQIYANQNPINIRAKVDIDQSALRNYQPSVTASQDGVASAAGKTINATFNNIDSDSVFRRLERSF